MSKRSKIKGISPSVFTKAAKLIANGGAAFGCNAIGVAYWWHSTRTGKSLHHQCYFSSAMFHDEQKFRAYWYGGITPENQMARSLGLLLTAELAKDGFIPPNFNL